MFPSPCIGACRSDDRSGLCLGCGRSLHEITNWRGAPNATRLRIWEGLPARRRRLGLRYHRLPWSPEILGAFVMASLKEGRGVWTMLDTEGVSSFEVGEGASCTIEADIFQAVANCSGGSGRFVFAESTIPVRPTSESDRVVLAAQRSGSKGSGCDGLAQLLGDDFPSSLVPWAFYEGNVTTDAFSFPG